MPSRASHALTTMVLCTALSVPALADAASQNSPPETHEFLVTIVAARRGAESMPDLPQPTVAALADLSSLLPYNNFTVVDAGWIRTSRHARVRLGEAGAFEVGLEVRAPEDSDQLMIDLGVDYREFQRDDDGRIYYGDSTNLLASSFGIRRGETVVVGTSRMNGEDEALIVLLHASSD